MSANEAYFDSLIAEATAPTNGQVVLLPTLNGNGSSPHGRRIAWQRGSNVQMRSIEFVDKPLLQADAFHLVVGRKGMGKGTLLANIAARVMRGELGPKRNVVWIGSDDSAAIDVVPRIVAAGGDPDRLLLVERGWVQLPRDIATEIEPTLLEMGDVGMVNVDPVGNHFASGRSSNDDVDVREAIAPLNDFADRHQTMVFGVRHLSEKECSRGVLAAILGSSAWVQVPRAVLAVARDDGNITHVQCVAGNRLPPDTPGRMFRIEGAEIPGLTNEVTRAVWIGDSNAQVEDLLASKETGRAAKRNSAKELVLTELRDGPKPMDQLKAKGIAELDISGDTVWKAANELYAAGIVDRRNSGPGTKWIWRLKSADFGDFGNSDEEPKS
jgi:hypothetical protein